MAVRCPDMLRFLIYYFLMAVFFFFKASMVECSVIKQILLDYECMSSLAINL